MKYKDIEEEIKDLTILIATAREEGDPEEHKEVVKEIMNIINRIIDNMIGEKMKEGQFDDFPIGYNQKVSELKEYKKEFNK